MNQRGIRFSPIRKTQHPRPAQGPKAAASCWSASRQGKDPTSRHSSCLTLLLERHQPLTIWGFSLLISKSFQHVRISSLQFFTIHDQDCSNFRIPLPGHLRSLFLVCLSTSPCQSPMPHLASLTGLHHGKFPDPQSTQSLILVLMMSLLHPLDLVLFPFNVYTRTTLPGLSKTSSSLELLSPIPSPSLFGPLLITSITALSFLYPFTISSIPSPVS